MSFFGPTKIWLSPDRSAYFDYDEANARVNLYLDGGTTPTISFDNAQMGFFGTAPAAQQSMTQTAVTAIGTTTISAANTSAVWGFASSTAANALVTRVDQMQVDLNNLLTALNASGLVSVA